MRFFYKYIMKYKYLNEILLNWNSEEEFQDNNIIKSSDIKDEIEKWKDFNVNGVDFRMITVPGGRFKFVDREPMTVKSFLIGETQVTQALWVAVMGKNPSSFIGESHPVEYVSWRGCQKFIAKLNKITGQKFRLPTEEEWEYAAKGGKQSKGYKYAGSDNIDEVAWYREYMWEGKTHPVKQKKPNELGIYDMSGNVYEFCDGNSSDKPQRGGAWGQHPSDATVIARWWNVDDQGWQNCGLRLAI